MPRIQDIQFLKERKTKIKAESFEDSSFRYNPQLILERYLKYLVILWEISYQRMQNTKTNSNVDQQKWEEIPIGFWCNKKNDELQRFGNNVVQQGQQLTS